MVATRQHPGERTDAQREERSEGWEGIVAAALVDRWKPSDPSRVLLKEIVGKIEQDFPEYRPVRSKAVTGTLHRVLKVKTKKIGSHTYALADKTKVAAIRETYNIRSKRQPV